MSLSTFDVVAVLAVIGGIINAVYAQRYWKSCYQSSAHVAGVRSTILLLTAVCFAFQRLQGANLPVFDFLIILSFIALLCLAIYEGLVKLGVHKK